MAEEETTETVHVKVGQKISHTLAIGIYEVKRVSKKVLAKTLDMAGNAAGRIADLNQKAEEFIEHIPDPEPPPPLPEEGATRMIELSPQPVKEDPEPQEQKNVE